MTDISQPLIRLEEQFGSDPPEYISEDDKCCILQMHIDLKNACTVYFRCVVLRRKVVLFLFVPCLSFSFLVFLGIQETSSLPLRKLKPKVLS